MIAPTVHALPSHTVAVRMPAADYRDLVRAALAARVTVSEYVRRCVAAAAQTP